MSNEIKGFRGKDGVILLDYSGVANVPGAVRSIAELTAKVGDHFEVAEVDAAGKITAVAAVEKPGCGGSGENPTGGGLSTTAVNLLMDVFSLVKFHSNPTGKLEALKEALLSGSSGGGDSGTETPDEPDEPVVTDDITVSDGVMTIVTVGSEIAVSGGVMTIA